MSSMTCPQCGTVNPVGARFCRACGLSLTQPLHQSGVLHAPPSAGAPTPPPARSNAPAPTGHTPPTGRTSGYSGGVTSGQTLAVPSPGGIGMTPLAAGVTLQNGRYEIDRPLGKGGMGSVFLARDTH